VDLAGLKRELENLCERGVPTPRLSVSNRAGLLMPQHRHCDAWEEQRLGTAAFGSTRSGIAPHYGERYEKRGVQVDDLFESVRFEQRVQLGLTVLNWRLERGYGQPPLAAGPIAQEQLAHAAWLAPLACDTSRLLHDAWRSGKHILFEGQLGALRDPDLGIYPYTTSSSPLASFALVGSGLPAHALTRVIAVTKAYSSCVGAGPFTTELTGESAQQLRQLGGDRGEFGATTGRPRRVGWFDAVATRYGCRIQGATELAITCLDVLGYLERIPVCTAYAKSGQSIAEFPTTRILEGARPVYEWLPGWQRPLERVARFSQLPAAAQRYVERIEELVEVPVRWVSIGPERSALIERSA
jgi:adenylosuccinate synthase